MDFNAVSIAIALLTILLAWYALLEYEDRRLRKGGKRTPEAGGRKAVYGQSRDAVTRPYRRSNGQPPPARRSSTARSGPRRVSRWSYGLAVLGVLLALLLVTLGNLLLSFPPLIFFGAAVAVTFTLGGRGPGLFALLFATLLSDFFFVRPTFVFSMDWQVFRLSLTYLLAGLLSLFISRRLSSGDPTI